MTQTTLCTEEVKKSNEEHSIALWNQLISKKNNISHKELPSKEDHKAFVTNHPYRKWWLLRSSSGYLGNLYITYDNAIGVNSHDSVSPEDLKGVIERIIKTISPMPEIKSIRAGRYHMRINPENNKLIKTAELLGLKLIENTYA